MPIDPEKLKHLMQVKNKPKRRAGGRRAKSAVDTSVRTLDTWFKLHHRFYDDYSLENPQPLICDNPDCLDPRPPEKRGRMVVEIDGRYMCRYCFIAGYHNTGPDQTTLEDGEAA